MKTSHAGDSRSGWILALGYLAVGLIVGFLVGRFDVFGPDLDQTGFAVVGRASSSAPNGPNSHATPASATRAIVSDDPAQLFSNLRSRAETAKESGNAFRGFAQLAPLILAANKEQLPVVLEMLDGLGSLKPTLLPILFLRWTEIDLEGALIQAESIRGPGRGLALQGLVMGWAESDPESAWAYLVAQEGGMDQSRMISSFMSIIAKSDPEKGVQLAERIDDPVKRNEALMAISYRWGNSDPDAAHVWAESVGDDALARKIMPIILRSMAKKDPGHAFDLALRATDDVSRQNELGQVIQTIAQRDPDRALELLQHVPEGIDAKMLVVSGSKMLGEARLETIDGYLEQIDDAEARNLILRSAVEMRATRGATEEAEQLLVRIPEGEIRDQSFRIFADRWSRTDPDAVQDWIDQLPAGSDRDFAISGFSRATVSSDPQGALDQAASIDTEAVRSGTISNLSRQWLERDRAAAELWIQASAALTPEQKHRLLLPRRE